MGNLFSNPACGANMYHSNCVELEIPCPINDCTSLLYGKYLKPEVLESCNQRNNIYRENFKDKSSIICTEGCLCRSNFAINSSNIMHCLSENECAQHTSICNLVENNHYNWAGAICHNRITAEKCNLSVNDCIHGIGELYEDHWPQWILDEKHDAEMVETFEKQLREQFNVTNNKIVQFHREEEKRKAIEEELEEERRRKEKEELEKFESEMMEKGEKKLEKISEDLISVMKNEIGKTKVIDSA